MFRRITRLSKISPKFEVQKFLISYETEYLKRLESSTPTMVTPKEVRELFKQTNEELVAYEDTKQNNSNGFGKAFKFILSCIILFWAGSFILFVIFN